MNARHTWEKFIEWPEALLGLIYPNLCPACGDHLKRGEKLLCFECLLELPYTDFTEHPDNKAAIRFWGRLPLESVSCYLYFQRTGRVRNLLHQLKYNKRSDIGLEMGRMFGMKLYKSDLFPKPDIVVPVPIHRSKKAIRGYNQAECIAIGIAESLEIPCRTDILIRVRKGSTQTRKNAFERWDGLDAVFQINPDSGLKNCHVLLVDDVFTTGATLEVCGSKLLECEDIKLSFATLAFADR